MKTYNEFINEGASKVGDTVKVTKKGHKLEGKLVTLISLVGLGKGTAAVTVGKSLVSHNIERKYLSKNIK